MPPEIPVRSQLLKMDDSVIRNVCREINLGKITYLNLFNNKIKKMEGLTQLKSLKSLILSYNEIEEIGDLS